MHVCMFLQALLIASFHIDTDTNIHTFYVHSYIFIYFLKLLWGVARREFLFACITDLERHRLSVAAPPWPSTVRRQVAGVGDQGCCKYFMFYLQPLVSRLPELKLRRCWYHWMRIDFRSSGCFTLVKYVPVGGRVESTGTRACPFREHYVRQAWFASSKTWALLEYVPLCKKKTWHCTTGRPVCFHAEGVNFKFCVF